MQFDDQLRRYFGRTDIDAVPAEAIARLLRERPAGVTGLAVPGMPLGSPGMEMGDRVQPYEVIAFGPDGHKVFASYP